METRARKTKSARRDAHAADAGEAIPRLLNDIVVTHISKLSISTTPPISRGSQR
jgi:hypothetical protein